MPEHSGIVIAGNFTADPVADSLGFWIHQLGWADHLRFAPYNQVFQSLLDDTGLFAANRKGVNVLLLRPDRLDSPARLAAAIHSYRHRNSAPLIAAFCPPGHDHPFANEITGIDSVYLIRTADLRKRYPVDEPFDAHAEQLGDVPYTPLFFAALGTAVARAIHALRARPFKVIALDCDNTLWQGTCGEDGPEGVRLDEPRRYLQNFMRAQRDAGVLLTISSKNNEADVIETFEKHPEMPLRLDDFIARRIDWEPKGANLGSLADELQLGLDTFILVDDNAKEIGEAKAACPDVLGIELPHNESRIPHFLDHMWAFDHLRVTEEDRNRHESYKVQIERGRMERQAASLEEFLTELGLEVHIQPMTEAQVPRVAQLTQRTNQMNTTLIRRTEQEVRASECLTVDVSDRFGSYGLVGAMFLAERETALVIEGFLLSCRALGRGVEQRMLKHAGELALRRGKSYVEIPIVNGPRNQPARQFVAALPSPLPAIECGMDRGAPVAPHAPAIESKKPVPATSNAIDYTRIARDLNRPQQILDAIRSYKRTQSPNRAGSQPPRTELERQLASIWSEVLHVPEPGINDDFFDLGGHSLLAVQLLSRVRDQLGAELSLDVVYTGKLTIETMAAVIELAQADPEEVSRLLAEIDNLSEEELQALLAEE